MKHLILVCLLAIPLSLSAQYFEVGLFGGASFYQGDIALSSTFFDDVNPAFGFFGRYNPIDHFSVKAHIYRGSVSAYDSNSDDPYRMERNLHFRSGITEYGVQGEFNILGFQPYGLRKVFSPYIFLGITGFHYNPRAEYEGEWYELHPLRTEGQGMEGRPAQYRLTSAAIPMGLGFKLAINDLWTIGAEFGYRKTFTDYLDDVSTTYVARDELIAGTRHPDPELVAALANRTGEFYGGDPVDFATGHQRGNSERQDWYFMGGLTISYNFMDNGLVAGRNRLFRGRSGCPGTRF